MAPVFGPAIVAAERLNGGVLVKFADGRCAFFSASLLYATLAVAEPQDEHADAW